MRDLIRNRRQEQIKRDVALLEKAIAGAPIGDPSDVEMAAIVKSRHHLRAERKSRARRPSSAQTSTRAKATEGNHYP
jgi:hypothetical protein